MSINGPAGPHHSYQESDEDEKRGDMEAQTPINDLRYKPKRKLSIAEQKAELNSLEQDIKDVHELIERGKLPF